MKTLRKYLVLLLMLLPMAATMAQYRPGKQLTSDEVELRADQDSSRLHVHASIFTGFYSGWRTTGSYMGFAPTLTYQASERLWLSGTVFAIGGSQYPSLVPYRNGRPPVYPEFCPGQIGLQALGADFSLRYKTQNNNYFTVHCSIMRDNMGLMNPYLFGPMGYMGYGIMGHFGDYMFGF